MVKYQKLIRIKRILCAMTMDFEESIYKLYLEDEDESNNAATFSIPKSRKKKQFLNFVSRYQFRIFTSDFDVSVQNQEK
jgi:hypothetical protein